MTFPSPDLAMLPLRDRRVEPAACFGDAIAPMVSCRGCYAYCCLCCIAAWLEQSLPGKRYRLFEVVVVAEVLGGVAHVLESDVDDAVEDS